MTMGDPSGVGPELALRAAVDRGIRGRADVRLVGSRSVFERAATGLGVALDAEVLDPGVDPGEVTPGLPSAAGALAAIEAVGRSARMCASGEADAMVTAPVSKAAIAGAGIAFTGHTEYLAGLVGVETVVMTFVEGRRRIALATSHVPLAEVPRVLTEDLILAKLAVLARWLDDWFGVREPRIAVAALNPHAGEGGWLGTEESRVIAPAIDRARSRGVNAEGPFPADTVYVGLGEPPGPSARPPFDAVLAMYHDQGTIPVKLRGFGAVNVTLGLPIVRTSPDHGTAFSIAGRGRADPTGMIAAGNLAAAIATRLGESA